VRCCNEIRPGFVLKVSPPEVAHIDEGISLLIVAVFAVLIRFAVMYGDRTLSLWFG
jgi:hypothetical protein